MRRIFIMMLAIVVGLAARGQGRNENLSIFLPKGYKIFDTTYGDLDKDGVDDCVLMIKGTDKRKIVVDEHGQKVDRNRRGIICLAKKSNHYEVMAKNYDCFSSENEDGGVYYPPELSIAIGRGNLFIDYAHGRYGYWKYTFRYQHGDFELIGYDESENRGPVTMMVTSINFLTKKKVVKENTNENPEQEEGQEQFKTTTFQIKSARIIKLSTVKDFDDLSMLPY